MGLEQHFSALKAAGFDDVDLCATLEEEDLVRIGVVLVGHRRRLLVAVRELDDHASDQAHVTGEPAADSDDSASDSEEPAVGNEKPDVDNEELAVDSEEPDVDSKEPVVDNEEPDVDSEEPAVDSEEPAVDNEEPDVDNDELAVDIEEPAVDNEEPDVDSEEPAVDSEDSVRSQLSCQHTYQPSDEPNVELTLLHASRSCKSESSCDDSDDDAFLKELDGMSDGGLSVNSDDLLAELDREFES
jgi:hypothetical protein